MARPYSEYSYMRGDRADRGSLLFAFHHLSSLLSRTSLLLAGLGPEGITSHHGSNKQYNDIQYIILNSQDVVDITEFDSTFNRDLRHYQCTAKVLHIYSDEALPIYFSTEGIV